MDSTVADPMTGRVLDRRYRVGPRIARGGMASVYEATDLRLDRVCALKVMHPALGDDDDVAARFVREARAAARLSHPHVVAVFDQGDDDGTVFLAMEHVEGRTLRDLVRAEAPLPPERALALLDPVLSALGAAHGAGLIHRDVKPENVLLADDGRIKVADFGLARAVSAETRHTSTGVLIGTVSYLSPELLVDGRADARCDVYAAGVVLYELLTGRKPHQGDSPLQVAYKHVHEDVPPPSRLQPDLPAYVDALVARATARDADLRPADARVMLHQLRRVRAALADGVHDDPELTSDLTPVVPAQRGWDEYLDEPGHAAPTVLAPAEAARAARTQQARSRPDDAERTGVIGTGDVAGGSSRADRRHGLSAARPARRRRGPLLLVLVLLLAAGAGAGAWWLGAGRYTTTPGVLDLPARAAEARLARAGLGFEVTGRAWSETVPAGSVVSTDPEGGENVVDGGTVEAVLSRGPERHDVPKVSGLPLDRAQAAIADARLSFGAATYVWSATFAKGVVVRADPKTGSSLRPDRAVDLVVSKGPKPVPVPDVSGDPLEEATRALRELDLEVETTRENDDSVPKGAVISQDPARGRLVPGETVELVVSKGPVLVDVPDVRRLSVDEAREALAAAGFGVRVVRLPVYVGLGVVVSQDPAGATRAPRGSTLTVSVV